MTLSLILACLWGVGANLAEMLPSQDDLWRGAYGLIVVGSRCWGS